jgi:ERCC4-type nuclease
MTGYQADRVLESMTVLVDTREQDTPQLRKRLEGFGCPFERAALKYGDYTARCTLPDGSELTLADKLVIERKQNATEICGNLTAGRERFAREFGRAMVDKAKVILLIECASWETNAECS